MLYLQKVLLMHLKKCVFYIICKLKSFLRVSFKGPVDHYEDGEIFYKTGEGWDKSSSTITKWGLEGGGSGKGFNHAGGGGGERHQHF